MKSAICFSQGFVSCKDLGFSVFITKTSVTSWFLDRYLSKNERIEDKEAKCAFLFTEKEWGRFDLFREIASGKLLLVLSHNCSQLYTFKKQKYRRENNFVFPYMARCMARNCASWLKNHKCSLWSTFRRSVTSVLPPNFPNKRTTFKTGFRTPVEYILAVQFT